MKNKKYYTVSTILKSNRKIAEKDRKSTPLILLYISYLGTDTSKTVACKRCSVRLYLQLFVGGPCYIYFNFLLAQSSV